MLELKGMLSIYAGEHPLGGRDRIDLLEKIAETGSISAAARAVGMSYKGAWDAIDVMNNLASEPLVVRVTGGRRGGGTALTERALRLIGVFKAVEAEHGRFVAQWSTLGESSLQDFQLMRRFMIRTSARNQLLGKVVSIQKGAVNDVIELEIQGGQRMAATVTGESTKSLGLAPGKEVIALIKASSVIVGLPNASMRLSARNQLAGKVSRLTRGAVNAEVSIQLNSSGVVVAIVTNASAEALDLKEGLDVVAIIKASSIILGTMV